MAVQRHIAGLVPRQVIQEYADRVVEAFHPERIILIGSQAWGSPGSDSDVDLLIIMDYEGKRHDQATRIRVAVQRSFPLDLVVMRPDEVVQRCWDRDAFTFEAMTRGLVLYDARS